jgi:hypothetical protein
MFDFKLSPPVELFGQTICSLKDAAYVIRQKAIEDNDSDARIFVRRLRDTDDLHSALLCAQQLRERVARSHFSGQAPKSISGSVKTLRRFDDGNR